MLVGSGASRVSLTEAVARRGGQAGRLRLRLVLGAQGGWGAAAPWLERARGVGGLRYVHAGPARRRRRRTLLLGTRQRWWSAVVLLAHKTGVGPPSEEAVL